MKLARFDDWTRAERTSRRREVFRGRWRRGVLVLVGVGLVVFAVVFTLSGLTPPSGRISGGEAVAAVPKGETMSLSVPKMRRVSNIPVYTADAGNTAALDEGAVHVRGTGFPWEDDSNVYIAGHRLGYPNTGSFMVFYDLDKLVDGDRVVLRDSEGKRYIYRVFEEITVDPQQVSVTEPIAGKEVVSLQACTLPDYSRRLIVRAELVDVEDPAQTSSA